MFTDRENPTACEAPPLPTVPRFSSLLNFLLKCEVGTKLHCDDLEAECNLTEDGWVVGGMAAMPAVEVVELLREQLADDYPEMDLNKTYVHVEPGDQVAVKREIMEEHNDDEVAVAGKNGMRLCEIDVTADDEDWAETATFDGGNVPEQVCFARAVPLSVCNR